MVATKATAQPGKRIGKRAKTPAFQSILAVPGITQRFDPRPRAIERVLKGAQARVNNARARDGWGGEAGTGRLSYRWPVASRLEAKRAA